MDDTVICERIAGGTIEVPRQSLKFRPGAYALALWDRRMLMVRMRFNGKLFTPGGGVELGETLEDAVRREAMEETGLAVEPTRLFRVVENFYYYDPTGEAWHALCFFCACQVIGDPGALSAGDPDEGAPEWVDLDGILAADFHGIAGPVVRDYLRAMRVE